MVGSNLFKQWFLLEGWRYYPKIVKIILLTNKKLRCKGDQYLLSCFRDHSVQTKIKLTNLYNNILNCWCIAALPNAKKHNLLYTNNIFCLKNYNFNWPKNYVKRFLFLCVIYDISLHFSLFCIWYNEMLYIIRFIYL